MTALPTDLIDIRSDARTVDAPTVSGLAESIAAVGLINPIRVRADGDRWEVVAGAHRLLAHRQLGLTEIECHIVTDDDLHAELAMIDENLCRAELSPSDRARQTARRKAIYLELHPETAHGTPGVSRQVGDTQERTAAERFTANTAAITGQSERAIQRDAERGENVIPEVLNLIKGSKLDTGTFLDKIKRYPPNDQFHIAERELSTIHRDERDENRKRKAAQITAGVKLRAAQEAAEILVEHVPSEWCESLKANLYAAGAKNIADAFNDLVGTPVMDRSAA